MRKFLLLLLFVLATQLFAHEFWMEPVRFHYRINDTASVNFFVGENFTGDLWGRPLSKISSLRHYTSSIDEDAAGTVIGDKIDSLKLVLKTQGTHLLTFNSTNSFIKLEAEKFNEYLKEDGLYSTIEYRLKHDETNKTSTEYYQRSVKTLLQCGSKRDDTYKKKTTLPLDIIPGVNPYSILKAQKISFKILFQQKPLAGCLVKVWHKQAGKKTTLVNIKADAAGNINTVVSPKGTWLVSCVNMVAYTKDTTAQWQSYWGSISFGY
ncbi:MAG: DUF4198 domain-containing protein [Ferruginibacter sp.]